MPILEPLDRLVELAIEEIDTAIAAWEAVRPADRNTNVLNRISGTYEANTFLVIRDCLHSQTAIAVSRLWDKNEKKSLCFARFDAILARPEIRHALQARHAKSVVRRVRQSRLATTGGLTSEDHPDLFGWLVKRLPGECAEARVAAGRSLDQWRRLYAEFRDQRLAAELQSLRQLRDKRLAHSDVTRDGLRPQITAVSYREIARTLRASEILIEKLILLVKETNLRFMEGHRVQAGYSTRYWKLIVNASKSR